MNLAYFRTADSKTKVRKKTYNKSKGGWKCGSSFISRKSKCFTDPVTGKKLKEPTTYTQYKRKRADSVKRKAKGQPLNDKEQIYSDSVESDRQKLKDRNFQTKTKKALKEVGYSSNLLSGGIADVDPQKVKVDPRRFQYKLAGANTSSGSVGSLAGVKKYDPNLAGIVQVWNDPKNKNTYVVNGHNRLALEKKLGVKKRPAKFLNVRTAKEARAVGALTNIAEGRGNARDAAKFFRDSGISKEDLEKKGVPLREKIATDGIAMSRLSDGLFNKVIQGDIPESRAVVIGDKLQDHTQQEALVKLIAKKEKAGRRITNDVVSELADMTGTAPKQQEGANLLTLLGFDPDERSLAIEKAEISASVKRQLNKDKKLFGTVGKDKAANELKKAGNKINIDMSAAISQSASTTLTLFEKKKFEAGKIDDVLNKSAERLANGEKKNKVSTEARKEIEDYLKEQFKYGKRSPNSKSKGSGNSTTKGDFRRYQKRLAQFAKERGWKCGGSFIPVTQKCYKNPKTGKINYKYIKNPKTGRRNKVKVALDYRDYQKARSKAVKMQGQGKRITQLQQQYIDDAKNLVGTTKRSHKQFRANERSIKAKAPLSVLRAEDSLRTKRFETLKIFTPDGKEISSTMGYEDFVALSKQEASKIKDNIFTHNHPGGLNYPKSNPLSKGTSFSGEDILMASKFDAKEVRVVSRGYRHSMKRPADGWGDDVLEHIRASAKMVRNYYDEAIDLTKKHGSKVELKDLINKANANHNHLGMEIFSKRIGAKYVREIWKRV